MARTIKGTVIDDSTSEPLVGASVFVKGSTTGTATDIDGQFTMEVPDKAKTLVVSYVGMTAREVTITDNMTIRLSNSASNLDEVVVVAYGVQKRSSVTGSVSQVDSKAIEMRPVSSVTSALEGTASGITVSGNYGAAGSEPSIYIRGYGTINGSTSPLYVIDGVPFGGNISDLNPEDVESMSVLKDAAACALYGNRAAGGVILITTKRSKTRDKVSISLKTKQGFYQRGIEEYKTTGISDFMNVSFRNVVNNYMNANKKDWSNPEHIAAAIQEARETYVNDVLAQNPFNVSDDQLFDAQGNFNTAAKLKGTYAEDLDWWDQALQTGYRGEYTLQAQGATEKSDYMFSLGYLKENGYMKKDVFERISGRANVNIQPTKWFKAGLNLSVSHQKNAGPMNGDGSGSSSYNNAFYFCRYMAPVYPVHLHDVNTGQYILNELGQKQYDGGSYVVVDESGQSYEQFTRNQNRGRHVIWENELNSRNQIRNTMHGLAYAEFYIPFGFTVKIDGDLNTRNTDYYSYGSAVIGDAKDVGSLSKTLYTYKNWTFQQQLTWNRTFNGKHSFNVFLGHENYSYRYDYTYTVKRDEAFPNIYALSNFAEMNSISGYKAAYRTESYLGRAQYNYDDRYNIEGSVRYDGSSRFAQKIRWGWFGSVGANWVFSNEQFAKDWKWLNFGKLYANWGQVGNDAGAGYYAYLGLFTSSTNNSESAYWLSQLPADDLKWETGESWGLGFEIRLFNRWNVSFEYFDKRNRDLIFDVNSPASAGSTSTGSTGATTTKNIGSISNRGIEISTDVDIYKNRDWKINFAMNLSTLKNKVTKMPDEYKKVKIYEDPERGNLQCFTADGKQLYANGWTDTGYTSGTYLISEGHSRYDRFTYHWVGVDQMTGRSLYTPDFINYYIKEEDGTIIGGIRDEKGELIAGACKQLTSADYVKINGQYYVMTTTFAGRQWCGDSFPQVYGSFTPSVTFKDLSISAMFTYSLGGNIYDSNYASLMSSSSITANNWHVDALNSWTGIPSGMTETSPDRISRAINPAVDYGNSGNNNATSDRWLISRNFLCLKNLSIAYNFPRKLVHSIGLTGLQINFQGENLALWSKRQGLNPMMNYSGGQDNYMVPSRTFTFGLSVNL